MFGFEQFADSMKVRLHLLEKKIFFSLDFDSDHFFLDPFFILKANYDPFPDYSYEQLFVGYSNSFYENLKIYFDENGFSYLPNIGNFKSELRESYGFLKFIDNNYSLFYNNEEIKLEFYKCTYFPETNIELISHNNPLLRQKFGSKEKLLEVEICESYSKHKNTVFKALDIIKRNNEWLYDQILLAVKKTVVFENDNIRSFASLNTLGINYISTTQSSNLIFFIEELIHQSSHNILYLITINMGAYFKVDAKNLFINKYNLNNEDKRTIYSALHGAFSLLNICSSITKMFNDQIFSPQQIHELYGRFSDNFKRLKRALNDINHPVIFTDLGWHLVTLMNGYYKDLELTFCDIVSKFDTSNQPYVFDYQIFLKTNPLPSNVSKEF